MGSTGTPHTSLARVDTLRGSLLPADVELTITPESVRIEVRDLGPGDPVVRPADPARLGGNGLRIVEAWSTEWGVTRSPRGGKSVWICLEV